MGDLRNKPIFTALAILLVTLGIDFGTKVWAQNSLQNERFHLRQHDYPTCGDTAEEVRRGIFVSANATEKAIIPNFFSLRYVENCGSSFNLLENVPEKIRFPFLVLISIFACMVIPFLFVRTPVSQIYTLYALPFILAGALGNLIDRMRYRFVVDFVDWFVVLNGKAYHWPTYNIADVSIVIGVCLMATQLLKTLGEEKTTADESKTSQFVKTSAQTGEESNNEQT